MNCIECVTRHTLSTLPSTAHGKYVDFDMVKPLIVTCRAAAKALLEVMALEPDSADILRTMGVRGKINITFLQSIKDVELQKDLLAIKDRLKR